MLQEEEILFLGYIRQRNVSSSAYLELENAWTLMIQATKRIISLYLIIIHLTWAIQAG